MRNSTSISALFFASLLLVASCTSTTLINSEPIGAEVYIDGQKMGTTPYKYSDTKIIGACNMLQLKKEGYETLHAQFCRNEEVDVGAIIGGLFIWPIWLWIMKYQPIHYYELQPADEPTPETAPELPLKTKAEQLRELKGLLEEGLIDEKEYEKEKKKILDQS